ncbi:P-loop containing nucleoside triphosphate hydrolase protein [Camillea tinctor]|nr:P-loop containing nucleoside triphosphate hydrolase protein [Camillea tinctor]
MADRGKQCEIQIHNIPSRGASTIKYGLKSLNPEGNSYAIVLERRYKENNMLESTVLQINSPHLLKIFKSVVRYYPAIPANFNSPFQMKGPFQMLFHYWDELHDQLDNDALGDDARMHLRLLLEFMKTEMGPSKEQLETMLECDVIGFSNMWTIFKPGCLVYTEVNSYPWVLRLEKTAYEENRQVGKFMEVHCVHTDYDGHCYGQATCIIHIIQKQRFAADNPSKIAELNVKPFKWVETEDMQEKLLERGMRFLGIGGIQVKAYDGLATYKKDPPSSWYDPNMDKFNAVWPSYTETGRIVLDPKTFKEENYSEGVSVFPMNTDEKQMRLLCPPYAYGFSLSRKMWCRFYIDNIYDITWNRSALDGLVLNEERKSILQALIFSHEFPDTPRDQTKHKGKGLVMLLHGSPGSGKTLTAESVAEATQKPLITATLGELDQERKPHYFEMRLKHILQYATTWRAVVLLDEADVFLEGRSEAVGDATGHNALVAVFLKYLEYFPGIIFLTSNRVLVFDKAMKSRIHLALEYKAPDYDIRRRIWTQYLSAIPPSEIGLDIEEDMDQFLRDEVNGREIANCINTARTLARFKGEKLVARHIHMLLETRREFDTSLNKMRAKRQQTDMAKDGIFPIARRDTFEGSDG